MFRALHSFSKAFSFSTSPPPPAPPVTHYKRELPTLYIRLNSPQGKLIFKDSLSQGSMQCYFPLAQQFITQSEPQTCGPTSLVMVLNSLNVDPGKQWKGIWRWYTEDNLNLITKEILSRGVDLQSWTHLAQHNYLDVITFYHPKCDLFEQTPPTTTHHHNQQKTSCDLHDLWFYRTARFNTFKDCILSSARRDGFILTINHSRKKMEQTGDGHYSPIGGYNMGRQLVLMLDVARFKYPSYWCDVRRLFDSLEDMDAVTGKPRGFVLISRKQEGGGGCRMEGNGDYQYVEMFQREIVRVRERVRGRGREVYEGEYRREFVKEFLGIWGDELRSLMVYYLFEFECRNTPHQKAQLFSLLPKHPLFPLISLSQPSQPLELPSLNLSNYDKLKSLVNDFTMGKFEEVMTIVLLSLPKSVFNLEEEGTVDIGEVGRENVKLWRKCFGVYREEEKEGRFG